MVKLLLGHYLADIPFSHVQGSLAGIPQKPDPTALLSILAQMEIKGRNGFYVGDDVKDVQAAHAAGLNLSSIRPLNTSVQVTRIAILAFRIGLIANKGASPRKARALLSEV